MGVRTGAAKTAAQSLEAIEAWSKRTFIAAAIAAGFLGMLTLGVLYAEWDYLRVKWAMQDMAHSLAGRSSPAPADSGGGLKFDPARGVADLKRSILGGGGGKR